MTDGQNNELINFTKLLQEDPAQRMLKSICTFLRTSSLWDQKGGDMKPADVADVLEREFGEGDA